MGETEAVDERRPARDAQDELRLLCKVDVQRYGLDVDWVNGALFHFLSRREVEMWVDSQNQRVDGNLHLKESSPDDEVLPADLYLHYRPPSG
jgi:hypothetical protein